MTRFFSHPSYVMLWPEFNNANTAYSQISVSQPFHAYPITFIPLESTFTLLLMQVIQHFVALFISISIPTTCSTKLYTWKYFVKHLFIILILEILVLTVIMPSNNYHITITYFHARLTLKKKHFTIYTIKITRSHTLFVCRWVQGETNRNEQATTTSHSFFS